MPKISELPAAVPPLTTAAFLALVAAGETRRATLDQVLGLAGLPYVAPDVGQWITTGAVPSAATNTNGARVANALDLYPYRPLATLRADQIGTTLTTAATGATGRFAIYASDQVTGRPSTKLFESAAVDFAATGSKVAAFGSMLTFERGLIYWVGLRCSAVVTVINIPNVAAADLPAPTLPTATAQPPKIVRRTIAAGTDAPASWVWSAAELNNAFPPHLLLRAA
jgi:hypothetical protein